MTKITLQDGKVVLRDGKVGTEQACCCEQETCCSCASSDSPFVDESCGLQAVIVDFDLSLLGPCQGEVAIELEATDVDLGFPFSHQQVFTTSGGDIGITAYLWCDGGCLAVQFQIGVRECNFCLPGSGLTITGSVLLSGENNEDGVCCPVGATYRYGPFEPTDSFPQSICPYVEVPIEITCVY